MSLSGFGRCALRSCVAAAFLAGCGGSQPPSAMPQELAKSGSDSGSLEHSFLRPISGFKNYLNNGSSWMSPQAKTQDLLYVSEYDDVGVYSYPQGKQMGVLSHFYSTVGLCLDSKGDVFATNQIPPRLYEYAHAGTKRIATLRIAIHNGKDDLLPVGCAVDPTTGNVAVTGFSKNIDIFKGGLGKPTEYTDKDFYFLQYCGYDDKGNLFIGGWKTEKGAPGFAELPRGSHTVTNIALDASIYPDGGVQWDGKHVAVFAFDPHSGTGAPVIYRFDINGNQGKTVGVVPLGSPADLVFQFFILGKTLIAPNWYGNSDQYIDVLYYNDPEGGAPTKTLTKRLLDKPRGAVVSLAPK